MECLAFIMQSLARMTLWIQWNSVAMKLRTALLPTMIIIKQVQGDDREPELHHGYPGQDAAMNPMEQRGYGSYEQPSCSKWPPQFVAPI